MVSYFIYILIISLQWLILSNKKSLLNNKAINKKFLFIACIELIILAGIRDYAVGADTGTYLSALNYYRSIPKSEVLFSELVWPYDFEIGYFLLTKICAFLGFNETIFLFFIASIIYIPIFVAIYRESKNPYESILTYFAFGLFAYSLGIFRQMIAISIVLSGIEFIKSRSFVKYFLLVLLAMLFHTTSLIGLILYFIYPMKWKTSCLIASVGTVIGLIVGRPIILLMVKAVPKYLSLIGSGSDVRDQSYIMLFLYIIIVLLSYCVNKIRAPQGINKIAFDAICLTCVVQSLGYSFVLFGRILGYYSIYLIFIIPNLVNLFNIKSRTIVKILVTICLIGLIFINLKANLDYINYTTFWM